MSRRMTNHSMRILGDLVEKGPMPSQRMNSGVAWKLCHEGLADRVALPSPFPTHKPGTKVDHLRATQKGIDAWKASQSK